MTDTDLYLLRFSGEVATKARRTRQRFTDGIVVALEDGLVSAGVEFRVEREWSRLFVHSAGPRAAAVLARVFGLQSLSPAVARPWVELADIVAAGTAFFAPVVRGRRFAVRARRTTGRETQSFTSPEVERALGTALLEGAAGVDLERPEVTAGVEVHAGTVYFFAHTLAGPGGLPMAAEGRALALISGGYDSAVAAWEAWKRGVGLDFVFFNLGGAAHEEGARRVVERLVGDWAYGDWPRLYCVDLRPLVEQLRSAVKPRYWQLVLKALMYQAADLLAAELALPALFTGEALGQVSSQTLPNLALLDRVVERPVLRPLLTWNKEQIVSAATAIGTAELSAAVPEFCALAAHQATTHAHRGAFARARAQLDAGAVPRAVAARTVHEPRLPGALTAAAGAVTVDAMPPAATVVDLRHAEDFARWHWPGALNLEYFAALKVYRSLDRRQEYVLYCDVGLKSAHLAELLRASGVTAHHLPAGVAALRRAAASTAGTSRAAP
jgi:thiamine biosynthesis protein ThiI